MNAAGHTCTATAVCENQPCPLDAAIAPDPWGADHDALTVSDFPHKADGRTVRAQRRGRQADDEAALERYYADKGLLVHVQENECALAGCRIHGTPE